jgi:hypothetical protein
MRSILALSDPRLHIFGVKLEELKTKLATVSEHIIELDRLYQGGGSIPKTEIYPKPVIYTE